MDPGLDAKIAATKRRRDVLAAGCAIRDALDKSYGLEVDALRWELLLVDAQASAPGSRSGFDLTDDALWEPLLPPSASSISATPPPLE